MSYQYSQGKKTTHTTSSVLLEESRGKTGGFSDWSKFFLSKTKEGSICHKILSEGQ
ncbi:hypothetical protein [Xanthocytophaga flava]|uniref:hypothetical protein n=1 Tax=Xanthocytophaga flava TaxID=3048013 RepID=UPI0028D907EB|nr:hypothetical protein [Xanthocytophaga flavus]